MICSKCGVQNMKGQKFCNNCGNQLQEGVSQVNQVLEVPGKNNKWVKIFAIIGGVFVGFIVLMLIILVLPQQPLIN